MVSQNGIGDDDDFSGNSDEGELFGFAGGGEGSEELTKQASAAACGEGRHVESNPHTRTSATDAALAAEQAAVIVEGGQTCQRSDGLGRAMAGLRQEGQQRGGGDQADARDGPQEALGLC
ncbi:hypothetical protein ASG47_09590 [Devosia sp. Leaf420]|nr:hypothetical protein [Devosia sp. Leaf420]KQT46864.1 hypothetical protein ASG47_09590 [Devosia sp. Leaf420]